MNRNENYNSKYDYFRGKKVPKWWLDYLPDEKNPYKDTDTLTLDVGCLSEYWYIHSSNKYPNYRGEIATEFVQTQIADKFGPAFIYPYSYSYSRGKVNSRVCRGYALSLEDLLAHPDNALRYPNAYLDVTKEKIHIKNARLYYEHVIKFIMFILREISSKHMQSGNYAGCDEFFPSKTDAELKLEQEKWEQYHKESRERQKELENFVNSEDFIIDKFDFKGIYFTASYNTEDGWFNEDFIIEDLVTNISSEYTVKFIIKDIDLYDERLDMYLYNEHYVIDDKRKRTLKINYCLCLIKKGHQNYVVIPRDKISKEVKDKINVACNQARIEYNKTHNETYRATWTKDKEIQYKNNIFLSHDINKLKMIYDTYVLENNWRLWTSYDYLLERIKQGKI